MQWNKMKVFHIPYPEKSSVPYAFDIHILCYAKTNSFPKKKINSTFGQKLAKFCGL